MRARALLSLLVLAGCNGPTAQGDIEDLRRRMVLLEATTSRLDNQVTEVGRGRDQTLMLTPGDDGWGPIETSIGRLTVSLQDVQPYANGSRVTLRIGNPLLANITRLELRLVYGESDANGTPSSPARGAQKIIDRILPGSWQNLTVDLEGVPPARLGHVTVTEALVERMTLSSGE